MSSVASYVYVGDTAYTLLQRELRVPMLHRRRKGRSLSFSSVASASLRGGIEQRRGAVAGRFISLKSCMTSCSKNRAAARALSLAHCECFADTTASLAACGICKARCHRCSSKTAFCKADRLSLYSDVSSGLRYFSRPRIATALMVTDSSSRRAL